jgi:hypothetical protein
MKTTVAALLLLMCAALPLRAEDNVLLIQTGPQGFTVWHTEGQNQLPDDDVLELMATATPEGGAAMPTPLGPARAYEMSEGIIIRLLAAQHDKALLVDRDACGHIIVWHADGPARLTDVDLTEAVMSALPEGGPRLKLGDRYAKAFLGRLGVTVTLWKLPAKK